MKGLLYFTIIFFLSVISFTHVSANEIFSLSMYDECLLESIKNDSDSTLLHEIRAKCKQQVSDVTQENKTFAEIKKEAGPVANRINTDKKKAHKPFTFMAHNKNYILLGAWNSHPWDSDIYHNTNGQEQLDLQQTEVQFQLSVKTPLIIDILESNIDAYAAYTGRSFWQAYNTSDSSPFRETNHEPEIWLQRRSDLHIGEFKNMLNSIGISHQSNGQGGELSRSWNRLYATFAFGYGDFGFLVKPWLRFEESAANDNNPDITDYLGHGHCVAVYTKRKHVLSVMSRNNLESGFTKGAFEFGWSFPFGNYNHLKGYIQYFTGYGESMIDYNNYVNRIGAGVIITDLL